MTDNELDDVWTTLEPTSRQRRRIDARVHDWLEARASSLANEWLELIRVKPVARLSFAAVAAGLALVASPLSWFVFAVV